MATLENLLVHAEDLERTKQEVGDRLARVRVRIAELQNLNGNSRLNNLPCIILSSIFEAGLLPLPDAQTWDWRTKETRRRFEILVSHVSRRWRLIALSTSRLWAEVCINFGVSPVELLDLYLNRSGIRLLNIMLHHGIDYKLDYERSNLHGYNFSRHLSSLLPHAARWRELTIHARLDTFSRTMSPDKTLLPLVNLRVPALEKITLGCSGSAVQHEGHDGVPVDTCINLFSGGAPALSSVTLRPNYIRAVRLPLGAVISLTLRDDKIVPMGWPGLAVFLKSAQLVTHLTLEGRMIYQSSTDLKPIELPFVRTLHLHIPHVQENNTSLNFPFVEDLTLEGFSEDVHRFPSYFHTSFPMLRSLKVITTSKYDVRDKGQTVNFIAAFPTIEEVVLTSKSTLLLVLGDRKPAKEPLWPELRIMTIVDPCVPWAERPDQSPVSLFDVIKAVKRRIVSGQPVFSVKLSAAIFKRAEQSHLEQLMEGTSLEVLDE